MKRPVYYLWKSDFQQEQELLREKQKYMDFGFRVVVFQDGHNQIQDGLQAMLKDYCLKEEIVLD